MSTVHAGPILQAAGDGDLETLTRLLELDRESANIVGANPYWGGRVQPLHMAVTWGQQEAVRMLLEAGAHPSGENDGYGGWSPLMLAASRGYDGLAQQLIDAGAYIGLYEAAGLGQTRAVADILAGNAERAQHVTIDGTTPLHLAATGDIADLLLSAGAVPVLRDGYGGTPLDAALGRAAGGADGAMDVAKKIIAAGAPTDICTLAALGDVARISAELDRSPGTIDAHNKPGATPLQAAVVHGRLEAVRLLLERGANPNIPDGDGIQPLHWVTRAPRQHLEIARLLLDAGGDPHGRDSQHRATPASWAEFQRRSELARVLRLAEGSGSANAASEPTNPA